MTTADSQSARTLLLRDLLSDLHDLEATNRIFTRSCPVAISASVAKPKRKRKRRNIAGPLTVVLGLILVLGAGYFAFSYVRAGIHSQRARDALRSAGTEITILRDKLKNADDARAHGDYKEAFEHYDRAKSDAIAAREHLLRLTAGIGPGPVRKNINTLATELADIINRADNALKNPKVGMGGRGFVEYAGKWMTPAERDKRFEERMKADGKVLYENEWLTPAEVARKRGLVFYQGRYISEQEYQKILAQKNAGTPEPKPIPPKPAPAPKPKPRPAAGFDSKALEWVPENFEEGHNWGSVPWKNANPCRLKLLKGSQTGRLEMELLGGKQDKSALVRSLNRLDISSRSRIMMDIENQCGENIEIAIALVTNTYHESRTQWLLPGLKRGISFDLTAGDFKCQASNWNHSARITRPNSALYLHILIYYNQPGKLIIDNIVAKGGK